MTAPEIRMIEELDESLHEQVVAPLRIYNREKNGEFFRLRELPENARKNLHLLAFDDAGQCVGGLIGDSQFSWLHVEFLVVHPSHRGKGLGRKLMAAAEKEAITRGCKYICLDTMDYQAPKFYEKLGYKIAGEFKDWDSHGHTKFYFVKTLAPLVPSPGTPREG